jgi:hypothetical protein
LDKVRALALLLFVAFSGCAAQEAVAQQCGKLTTCPPATTLNNDDQFYVVQSNTSKRVGWSTIVANVIASQQSDYSVPTNAALQALSTALYSRVTRQGFYAAGDGGFAVYYRSTNPCGAAVTAVSISAAGTGYNVGDTVQLSTGTGSQAYIRVTSAVAGVPSAVAISYGGLYSAPPTGLLATAATSGGGSGLTLTANVSGSNPYQLASPTIGAGGAGYAINDVGTIIGGTGTAATYRVDSVNAGAVTALTITSGGSYTVAPSGVTSTTAVSGIGSGLTLTRTMTFGSGDNGSEVSSADGKCWLVDYVASPLRLQTFGAKGDASHNDAPALQAGAAAAYRLRTSFIWGHAPGARWVLAQPVVIEYFNAADPVYTIYADGAFFLSTITDGAAMQVQCGVTTGQDSRQCQGGTIAGKWQLRGTTPHFIFVLGKPNLSDVNQSFIIEDMLVYNSSTSPKAGGCMFNFPVTDNLRVICDTFAGGGINPYGPAAGATIVGASMSLFTISSTAGSCIYYGLCDDISLTQRAMATLVTDPLDWPGATQPPGSISNTFSGGDMEVGPGCFGNAGGLFIGNSLVSQFMACNTSITTYLPTNVQVGGTAAAGNTITLTASGAYTVPTVSYTAAGTEDATTVATGLAAAFNADTTWRGRGYYAVRLGTVVRIVSASSAVPAAFRVAWTTGVTGGITQVTGVSTECGGNVILGVIVEGQPSWTRGYASCFEIYGQGVPSSYQTPYGSTYQIDGLDSNGLISSYNAASGAPTVVTTLGADASNGASAVVVADATGIIAGMSVYGLYIPAGVTVASVAGTTVNLTGGTVTVPGSILPPYNKLFTGVPIAFLPASAGTPPVTATYTLPDCNTVNGAKTWRVSVVVENSNPITLTTTNSQQIARSGVAVTSLTIPGTNYDVVTVRCDGAQWLLENVSEKIIAINGLGNKAAFTPVLKLGANTQTQTSVGWYSVSEKMLTFEIDITVTAIVGTGTATVTGLPIAANLTGGAACTFGAGMVGLTGTVLGYIQGTTMTFSYWGAVGTGGLVDTNFSASSRLICNGTYITQ